MRFIPLAIAALTAPSAFAATLAVRPTFGCGTREPTAAQIKITEKLAAYEEAAGLNNPSSFMARQAVNATINVDVYFHVVAASTALTDGYLTTKMVADQFKVLQDTFGPEGFTFTLKGTDWTINKSWADDGAELAMKKALRKGTYRTLNVYFTRTLGGNFGYCYFPTTVTTGSDDFYLDGCSILYTTVPGGSATNYNLGYTVTHEVGHWFGLYHTFQGGCTGSGDFVSDTPAQASSTSGCPTGRDSCPSQAGLDPIHNFMDYSYDTCYTEFTAGQKTRINTYFTQYRANK
ncbi:hypothetical protein B0H67DRAFT_484247 [Lasiosphaeris hirsuta]|uniref:Peptidase M43 pregnancy-associated plasma-A domain-containing protein n=1 Tax=Lasiosphaeris hirsuta TaxID=260670 RepID=A0AA40AS42_9PEZI|nr:hypothetical protein B0H67DRAFT_484247 [Lasiosphaeris hirsuta]